MYVRINLLITVVFVVNILLKLMDMRPCEARDSKNISVAINRSPHRAKN